MRAKDGTWRLSSVRPLVRYVDEDQAVIDTHIYTLPALPTPERFAPSDTVELLVQIRGADGFHDEGTTAVRLVHGEGSVRFDLVQPQRWWPAGMGEQPLYELTVSLASDERLIDQRRLNLGLTSVRREGEDAPLPRLLVNGRACTIRSVVNVDRIDENQLLPASGDSILLVRDHYGPDVLYEAADRAGVLLVQCVPVHEDATPETDLTAQVDRLSAHPSLAGWYVGHLGSLSDRVAELLRTLDPTRSVFRELPMGTAAA